MVQTLDVNWIWSQFQDLSNDQLYQLLKLRQDVFILEQQCFYPDMDDLDSDCIHLLGYQNNELVAYLRLIPAEFHDSGNIALGRIIAKSTQRGSGLGKAMMTEAMDYLQKHFPEQDVQMSAQDHLQKFYNNFGFSSVAEAYDEDGIPHIMMLYQHSSK
ncbi:MAG: GNAT family N-acetyltransferase [Gammaproteobacteria bacterium]|nr:MAG: GNAT family N-acetyltransferase [Gammaproteobacteria bacterium]